MATPLAVMLLGLGAGGWDLIVRSGELLCEEGISQWAISFGPRQLLRPPRCPPSFWTLLLIHAILKHKSDHTTSLPRIRLWLPSAWRNSQLLTEAATA